MADLKISQLTGASTPLAGTEVLPIVQSGSTVKTPISAVQAAPVAAGTANAVQYLDGSKAPSTSSNFTYNGVNLGVATAPVTWSGGTKGIDFGADGNALVGAANDTILSTNAKYVSNTWTYGSTNPASYYEQYNGTHTWFYAPSGTGGTAITFQKIMETDASKNLKLTDGNLIQGTAAKGVTTGGSFALGLGTNNTTNQATLHTTGNISIGRTDDTNDRVSLYNGSSADFLLLLRNDAGTQNFARFQYAGITIGSITGNASNTAYNTSSDYRLKDGPTLLTGSGDFIDALKPKSWIWKSTKKKGVGFIAHEVQQVSPDSVVGEKDAVDENGDPVYQAMEYGSSEFIANIVAELQSLRHRIAQLEQAGK